MGISAHRTVEWREVNQVLDSDDVNVIQEEDNKDNDMYVNKEVVTAESSMRESQKRLISIQSTASRDGSPTKKHQGF